MLEGAGKPGDCPNFRPTKMGLSPFPAQSRQGEPCRNHWTRSSPGFSPIPACADFILADAKDADMAYGIAAPGRSPEHHAQEGRFRSLDEYRELIRAERPAGTRGHHAHERQHQRGADDPRATVRRQCGDAGRAGQRRHRRLGGPRGRLSATALDAVSLGLDRPGHVRQAPLRAQRARTSAPIWGSTRSPSTTTRALDHRTLEAYRAFREEAAAKNFRHFLEVFDPNAPQTPIPDLARFTNDMIVRALAGVAGKARPLFLKVVYHGPAAMEQLAGYDSRLIVGILGGASGSTLRRLPAALGSQEVRRRVALYGRMINHAEHQLTFIEHLRGLADGRLEPAEAVRSYHAALQRLKIRPYRSLEEDLRPMSRGSAYGSSRPAAGDGQTGRRQSGAGLLQDDAGGKAGLEPGPLEANPGVGQASLNGDFMAPGLPLLACPAVVRLIGVRHTAGHASSGTRR